MCEALYLDSFISKQQLRRAIQRLCTDFDSLVEVDNPRAIESLAIQLSDFANKNLLRGKVLTLIPTNFTKTKLANTSSVFRETFTHELSLIKEK